MNDTVYITYKNVKNLGCDNLFSNSMKGVWIIERLILELAAEWNGNEVFYIISILELKRYFLIFYLWIID